MESADLSELAVMLRAERPEPDRGWAARLDERAAAGFPRGGRRGPLRAGGWLAPAGALATLLLVVVAIVAVENGGRESTPPDSAAMSTTAMPEAGGGALEQLRDGSAPSASHRASGATKSSFDAGKIAPGTENRKVDRDAQLSLSAQPEDVRGVSDEVISITRSLGGIVDSSQIRETADGASAALHLTLPTRNLDSALDRMTDLADVDSLNETATDITRPVVSAKDELRDAEARRRELLQALGNATTESEADALELKIADARHDIAKAEAAYERITRKARLSSLDVNVASNPAASEQHSFGDWLDDAGDVLRTIAGVLLIAAAILVPLGLLAAIVAFVVARLRRRRRERALDG